MIPEHRRPTPKLPESIQTVYLIGICGTGMGSLAAMLKERGLQVIGSDQGVYPPMSTYLEARDIAILKGWDGANISTHAKHIDLVVVGNVCRRDNPEVLRALELGLCSISFPETLRLLFLQQAAQRAVVTGTHGKTTTSSMLAWILEFAGLDPSFMIGGITGNFGSNYKLGGDRVFVIEGDEYDSAYFDKVPKFWHYEADLLILGNIEFDHADIYANIEEIEGVFAKLIEQMPASGTLWANANDPRVLALLERCPCSLSITSIGAPPKLTPPVQTALWAEDIAPTSTGGTEFSLYLRSANQSEPAQLTVQLPMVGQHNLRNAMMAAGLALSLGVELKPIVQALSSFKGVRKRQELVGIANGVTIYDDFAHHPTAVRETLAGIRTRHPEQRIWAIFEAKSNTSRRAVFQEAYPEALAAADFALLSAPWKKDNLPPEALIDLNRVVTDLQSRGVDAQLLPEVDAIVDHLIGHLQSGDVVIGMSGSSFGGMHQKLLNKLENRAHRD